MNNDVLQTLQYWTDERESIRAKKEAGHPKPWTKDPILQSFKFCNVHREDDYVTHWFQKNWRAHKYWREKNFIATIILGRTINWPPTLEYIGFPYEWEPIAMREKMDRLQKDGEKVYTGAYMITAGPAGVGKNEWVLGNAKHYFNKPPILDRKSIQRSWERIIANAYPCVGPFIAGQVIADLKYTSHLADAEDWWDWAAMGPGSMRGLNRIHDRKIDQYVPQGQGLKEMREVSNILRLDLHLQDVQNCLCELDKYMRVKLGQGKPRSGYNGRGK